LPLKDSELKRIKQYEEIVSFLLRRYKVGNKKISSNGKRKKSINDAICRAMRNELHWAEWKGLGCKPFSKSLDDSKTAMFWDTAKLAGKNISQEDKNKWFMKGQGNITMPDYSQMGKRNKSYEGWFATDKMYTHMDAIDRDNIIVIDFY